MIRGLDHIAITVTNLEQALKIFQFALGLKLEHVEDIQTEAVRVAFLSLPGGQGVIELMQPTTEDSGVAKYLAKRGEGMHHLCLEVENIAATISELGGHGLQVLDEKPRIGTRGQKYAFIHPKSANGVMLELYERPQPS